MNEFKMQPSPKPKERYQARFWCDPDLYARFKFKCDQNGTDYSNAFRQLMTFYVNQATSRRGR